MRTLTVVSALIFIGGMASAGELVDPGLSGTKLPARQILAPTEWVAKQLDLPNVRILDVSSDPETYDKGHLPGAVKINWKEDLFNADKKDIPTPQDFIKLCKRLAIAEDTLVIFYGDEDYYHVTYAYWIFAIHAHINVKVLDGGRKKWALEKRPFVTDAPKLPEVPGYQIYGLDMTSRATLEEVTSVVKQILPGVLIDARPPEAFAGKMKYPPELAEKPDAPKKDDAKSPFGRAGHIRGAVNLPPSSSLLEEDGTFKSEELLRKIFLRANVEDTNICYSYGWTRERSCFNWFVLRAVLNYREVRVYDGGWLEYSNTTLPIGPGLTPEK